MQCVDRFVLCAGELTAEDNFRGPICRQLVLGTYSVLFTSSH